MKNKKMEKALESLLLAALFALAGCKNSGTNTALDEREFAWGTAQLLENDDTGDAYEPQIASDANGNAIAVWQQYDGTRNNIWARRYTRGSGWGTAQNIESNDDSAAYPRVAIGASGDATVVWYQSNGTGYDIWANNYRPDYGWNTAQVIETDTGFAFPPRVVVDTNGNAIAVWSQNDGFRHNIWANRFTPDNGWGTAEIIEADNGNAVNPRVAVDGYGNAISTWQQFDGTNYNIWINRYSINSGWSTPQLIENDNTASMLYPEIAVDANGDAVVVWQQYDGFDQNITNIWANNYSATSDWGTAQLIETDNTGHAWFPKVAIDGSGNAIAVWHQNDGVRDNVWANNYTSATGWNTAKLIESNDVGSANNPQIAFDTHGNAITVWRQYDGSSDSIWANRYAPSSGWSTAQLIETDSGSASGAQITIDGYGRAIAVWQQMVGQLSNIFTNSFE